MYFIQQTITGYGNDAKAVKMFSGYKLDLRELLLVVDNLLRHRSTHSSV